MSLDAVQSYLPELTPQEFAMQNNLPFRDLSLLHRALTHSSFLNEHPEAIEDNERLEFLGDAVLDFLVGAWLYNRYPDMLEGNLTRLRSALVRTENLAHYARALHLDKALRLGRGEAESGGKVRQSLLCAAFEALIGALYLDSGVPVVEKFLIPFLEPSAHAILSSRKDRDPKSVLQEWTQSQGLGIPIYQLVHSSGPEHAKVFEVEVIINKQVIGHGEGHSKQQATKMAAAEAIKHLDLEK